MKKGFSFLEIILVLSLGGVVLSVVMFSYLNLSKGFLHSFEQNYINNNFATITERSLQYCLAGEIPQTNTLPYSDKIIQEVITIGNESFVSISARVSDSSRTEYYYHNVLRLRQ